MRKVSLFDVIMGAHDDTEACELVGTFVLVKTSVKYDKK